ncbi:tetratricopeptide repeat protein [Marinilongibacter aquaticus]|uniref:tetratricopeptide repeat protein n=1 Tax=Marinilongibacter aquaticus TaxID=2975157 RepID=UPI0021BD2907|nr:tetratricopeptide repeat protein [Marinilongibacter aquaticus]UBM60150.1 tetratricopeptide repeat protein [Marinilongibacter aquaticus]
MRVIRLIIILLFMVTGHSQAQLFSWFGDDDKEPVRELLMDRAIQIETTEAINNMYNFKFHEAEVEFKWLLVKYRNHPIGHFLLGLNDWWRIVPDTGIKLYDNSIHEHMDKTIDLAEGMLDRNPKSKEAAFFIAAAYAFKGRLYSERESWVKAAWAGKQALKYLEKSRGDENINPELLFGDGVYNYYSKWIQENYKSLRPLLTFFRKGNKKLGIQQLEEVAQNAFYTRMEARYFLMQIYSLEGEHTKSLRMAQMMHSLYPDNPFFHRYVARGLFVSGRTVETEKVAKELLENIAAGKVGYGPNDGRYAAYMLAYVNQHFRENPELAKKYYEECIRFSSLNDSEDSGYYLGALMAMADMNKKGGNLEAARADYLKILDQKQRSSSNYKEAKEKLKEVKREMRKQRKKKP